MLDQRQPEVKMKDSRCASDARHDKNNRLHPKTIKTMEAIVTKESKQFDPVREPLEETAVLNGQIVKRPHSWE